MLRTLTLILATASGLAALATAIGSLANRPAPVWAILGFEAVALLAAWFTLRATLARPQHGYAMTLLCTAGCTAVAAYLGSLAAAGQLAGIPLKPFVLARLALAALFATLAAIEVLRHDTKNALLRLLLGIVLAAPALVCAFCVYRGVGLGWFTALGPPTKIAVMIGGGLVVGGLFCAGAHLVILAFQGALARADSNPPTPTPSTPVG